MTETVVLPANEITGHPEIAPKASPTSNKGAVSDETELTGQPEATPKASSVVSDRKKLANKANAQKSTGPRTAEGKARVSENALKHGLRSTKNPLDISTQIPGEQTQFEELLADLSTSLQPANPAETQLVARLAQLTLRLHRAAAIESATLDQARADALERAEKFPDHFPDPNSPDFETSILANTFTRASATLKLLSQYESRLSLDFNRTLRQLQQLQKITEQTQPALDLKGLPNDEPQIKPIPSLANHGQVASRSPNSQPAPKPQSPPDKFVQTNPTLSPPSDPKTPLSSVPPAGPN